MNKVKLLKAFTHNGRSYNAGDEFEGTDAEIQDLVRQGYVKHEEKEPPEPHLMGAGNEKSARK